MSVLALSGWKRSSVTEVTHPTDCLHNHAAQLSCDCLSDFLKSPAFQVTVTNPSLVTDQFIVCVENDKQTLNIHRNAKDVQSLDRKLRQEFPLRQNLPEYQFPKSSIFPSLFLGLRRNSQDSAVCLQQYVQALLQDPEIRQTSHLLDFLCPHVNQDDQIKNNIAEVAIVSNILSPKLSLQDFHLLRVLGKGCMGKVFLSRLKSSPDNLLAIKAIAKRRLVKPKEQNHVRKERDILALLSKIHHPFLIQLKRTFQDDDHLYMVMEYHPGGDIATELMRKGVFDEKRIKFTATEIICGLSELHRLGIVYRDLKPENILIGKNGHLVLTDFGLSKQFRTEDLTSPKTNTFCGTAEYLAPEVLRGDSYTFSVDWWSLGTLLYEMYYGVTPFWAEDHMTMYYKVLSDPLRFNKKIPPSLKHLVQRLLERDPCQRLGGQSSISIHEHPYFSDINWDQVLMSQLEPVYVPTLNHEEDMAHFDEEFLQMTPRLSYQTASGCLQNDENLWQGFSFVCNTFNADNANATSSCIQNKREKAKVMEQWNEELPLLNVSVETLSVARESLEEAFGLEL